MSKNNTLKKILAVTATVGAGMYIINQYISKIANEKNLVNDQEGSYFHWKYGEIFYHTLGSGQPILLVHDIHESSSGIEWSRLEKELAKDYTVYTIDLLGCGRSDRPNFMYHQYLYVQLLQEFIDKVIQEKTTIVATGYSAAVAIMTAKLEPDRVDALKLINPADLFVLTQVPGNFEKIYKNLISCPILGTFIYHMTHKKQDILNIFCGTYYGDPEKVDDKIVDMYYESAHKDESRSKYLYASRKGKYLNLNIRHAIKSLQHPTTILWGEEYPGVELIAQEYNKINEEIRSFMIPGAGYLPQLEKPEEVIDFI